MPHQRLRHIQATVKKRSKVWPVLGLLGPRQVGKSTFLRDLYANPLGAPYLTLDRKGIP